MKVDALKKRNWCRFSWRNKRKVVQFHGTFSVIIARWNVYTPSKVERQPFSCRKSLFIYDKFAVLQAEWFLAPVLYYFYRQTLLLQNCVWFLIFVNDFYRTVLRSKVLQYIECWEKESKGFETLTLNLSSVKRLSLNY